MSKRFQPRQRDSRHFKREGEFSHAPLGRLNPSSFRGSRSPISCGSSIVREVGLSFAQPVRPSLWTSSQANPKVDRSGKEMDHVNPVLSLPPGLIIAVAIIL